MDGKNFSLFRWINNLQTKMKNCMRQALVGTGDLVTLSTEVKSNCYRIICLRFLMKKGNKDLLQYM